jgi:hypothetical protein
MEIIKYSNQNLSQFTKISSALERFLPDVNEEKARKFWDSLTADWKIIFWINYEYSIMFSQAQNLKSISGATNFIISKYTERCRKFFVLDEKNITSEVLKKIMSMEILDASLAYIVSCAPIAYLAKLKYIDLSVNNISDITPLAGMKNIVKIDINSNFDFQDSESVLQTLPNLEILWIYNTKISPETLYSLPALKTMVIDLEQANRIDFNLLPKLKNLVITSEIYEEDFSNRQFRFLENILFDCEILDEVPLMLKKENPQLKIFTEPYEQYFPYY